MKHKAASVCRSKIKYTTLKSVERAKAVISKYYQVKFEVYRCGTSKHYHLTHANPEERIGHGTQLEQQS